MKELIEEIVNHCDGIIERSERMTSGNYMHNCLANRFSANTIKTCMGLLSKSVIKWQTGEPAEDDWYLVSLKSGYVNIDYFHQNLHGGWLEYGNHIDPIIAWCKLDNIAPYKE